jgi:hypothetical protein
MAKIGIDLAHPELCLGCPYVVVPSVDGQPNWENPIWPPEGCDYFQYAFDTDKEWCAYNRRTKEILSYEDWNEGWYDEADEKNIVPTAKRPPRCIEKFGTEV